ncbi:MAG: PIN domain-containing protein [Nitrospiraceae bacterium]
MRLVLDTNILIAAPIKDSITRRILLLPDLEFLLPAFARDELARHRTKIVRAARLKGDELDLLLTLLLTSVAVIPFDRIAPYLPAADALTGAIDPDDVPFVALALAGEHDGIWSNDRAFENLPGIQLWTTTSLKTYLRL